MNTMKRFALAALFVLGATLCPSAQAQLTVQLTPTTDAPSGAWGQATLTNIKYKGETFRQLGNEKEWVRIYKYTGDLAVTCHALTPGATYYINGVNKKFRADPYGTLQANVSSWGFAYAYVTGYDPFGYYAFWVLPELDVYRINSGGSTTTVLYGTLPYPP
jgi:hypothetical protein